jgi:hypothetical protein
MPSDPAGPAPAPARSVDDAFAQLEAALKRAAAEAAIDAFDRITSHLHHTARMRKRFAEGLGVADRGKKGAA